MALRLSLIVGGQGGSARPIAFLVGRDGVVRGVRRKVKVPGHAEVLKAVRDLG